jgi:hypothetical protein
MAHLANGGPLTANRRAVISLFKKRRPSSASKTLRRLTWNGKTRTGL